jgi:glycosyltransferase involved in cell wall biosynthesis
MQWHLVTCEYPPAVGGVADYSREVAEGLAAAGDEVHVWCPAVALGSVPPGRPGVHLHPVLGAFRPGDLCHLDAALDAAAEPHRVLVQWVPHGYGYRSMNVRFCAWVWRRARRGSPIDLMVHEPYLAFHEGSWRQDAAAVVHRLMTMMLIRAATRIWVSIPTWAERWRPFALGKAIAFTWLPIPCTLPAPSRDDAFAVRGRYAGDAPLVGHVGTYGAPIRAALAAALPPLLDAVPAARVLLLGEGAPRFAGSLAVTHRAAAARIHAPGRLSREALAAHVAACDLLLQPYPDGVSSRRTSAMAGLALGVPVVTNAGPMTEAIWAEREAVALIPGDHAWAATAARLLVDPRTRSGLAERGRALYEDHFALARTIAALRAA